MKNLVVTFCGHKEISNKETIKEQLVIYIRSLLTSNELEGRKISFYCGGYGAFDSLVADSIRLVQAEKPQISSEMIFITPYITESYSDRNKDMKTKYDEIIYPPLENVPLKFAISRRNQWMVDNADIVVSYVAHSWGGAAKTLEYAKQKNKQIIQLN